MPGLLLATAALDPSVWGETAIVAGGGLALAVALTCLPGLAPFAVAALASVVAIGVDVVAGSTLTSLSLLGPNPALGVRFYGIGNELEATVAVLALTGVGCGLAAAAAGTGRARAAFAGAIGVATLVFAAGRWGADVGAAIVLPAGLAAAMIALGRPRTRLRLALLAGTPLLALAALALVDLVSGGDSHLSRSVLHAGGLDSMADVADRRLRLSARSFTRASNLLFLALLVPLVIAAARNRRRIAAWFEGRETALAGLIGAVAATLVGTLANDSGALLLVVGAGFIAAFLAHAWARAPRA
jgi:hypothetical protein